jgi:cellulose synthase/poly-beta-1,6-N-acetylglucosamine synthase-like glycosyltransferase
MTIIICCFSILSFFYLCATVFLYHGLRKLSSAPGKGPRNHSFSIIIAAHNEEATITSCLESVFSQTIGSDRYEVIIVDDRSTDATNQIIRILVQRYSNLRLITVQSTPRGLSPKKYAVSLGIAQAKNEVIVFTDADCRVAPTWLSSINHHFTDTVGMVQGITTYFHIPGMNAFFFGIQSIDFLSHGVVAAAAIGSRFPLNSNANNLAFKKMAFEEVGGYGTAGSVVSGDDDLLLQRLWKSKKWEIRYMCDAAGSVQTAPSPTLRAMFEQRKRWGSKTVHYNARQVFFLGGIFCFYVAILAGISAALVFPGLWLTVAGMLVVKAAGELLLLIPGTRIFDKMELRKFIIPASIMQLPLVVGAVVMGVFGKFRWKEQKFGRTIRVKPDKN